MDGHKQTVGQCNNCNSNCGDTTAMSAVVRLLQAAPSSKRSWPAGTDLCGTYNGYCNGVVVVLLLPMLCWSMVMPMMMTIAASVAFNCSRNVRYGINIVIATNWQLVLPFVSFLFLLLCVTFAYFSPPLMLAVVRVNRSQRTSVFLFGSMPAVISRSGGQSLQFEITHYTFSVFSLLPVLCISWVLEWP